MSYFKNIKFSFLGIILLSGCLKLSENSAGIQSDQPLKDLSKNTSTITPGLVLNSLRTKDLDLSHILSKFPDFTSATIDAPGRGSITFTPELIGNDQKINWFVSKVYKIRIHTPSGIIHTEASL